MSGMKHGALPISDHNGVDERSASADVLEGETHLDATPDTPEKPKEAPFDRLKKSMAEQGMLESAGSEPEPEAKEPEVDEDDPEPKPEVDEDDPEPKPEVDEDDPEPKPEVDEDDPEPKPEVDEDDPDALILAALERAEGQAKPKLGRLPNADYRKLSPEGRQAFDEVRQSMRDAVAAQEKDAPFATYGRQVLEFGDEHGITAEEMSHGLAFLATVKKGGESAVNALLTQAKALGYEPPAAPAAQEQSLPADIKALYDNGYLDDDQLRVIRKHLPPTQAATAEPQSAGTQPQPIFTPAPSAQVPNPAAATEQQAWAQAQADLQTFNDECRERFGEKAWSAMIPMVEEEAKAFQGMPPAQARKAYEKCVELVVAKAKARRRKAPAGLAPSSAKPTRSNAKRLDKLTGRARIVEMNRRGMI